MNKNTLVIGPGKKTRGGITSVINAHSKTETWKKWNCIGIASYIDRNDLYKIMYFLKGYLFFLLALPASRIIHIHFSEPSSAQRKNYFLKTAKLFGKRVILHFHAFSPETTLFGKKKDLYRKMFNQADIIVALSYFWKDEIEKVTDNPQKIKVIYNPCPIIEFSQNVDKCKEILFAGTLNKRKGYKDLILAFSKIAMKHSDWNLVFAGNGELKEAKKLAKDLGIENQVVFKGWVSGKVKQKIFSEASIFCLPSYAEGFPMAILDAWSYGLPVITTPVGGLPDILEHGKNALVFEAGNIIVLSQNLNDLIINKELRDKIGHASFLLSETRFNIATIAKDMDVLYNELLIN